MQCNAMQCNKVSNMTRDRPGEHRTQRSEQIVSQKLDLTVNRLVVKTPALTTAKRLLCSPSLLCCATAFVGMALCDSVLILSCISRCLGVVWPRLPRGRRVRRGQTYMYNLSKHGSFTRCCFNVGPASATLAQH